MSLFLIKLHAIKEYGRVEVQCHVFLTCTLDVGESSSLHHSHFIFEEETSPPPPPYLLGRWPSGVVSSLWRSDKPLPPVGNRTYILLSANP